MMHWMCSSIRVLHDSGTGIGSPSSLLPVWFLPSAVKRERERERERHSKDGSNIDRRDLYPRDEYNLKLYPFPSQIQIDFHTAERSQSNAHFFLFPIQLTPL